MRRLKVNPSEKIYVYNNISGCSQDDHCDGIASSKVNSKRTSCRVATKKAR
eukprot:m.337640 g.337640  ORF g.337640 m.337640 type:complete len:51 (-) comp18189_c0_seq1:1843-1995(-)